MFHIPLCHNMMPHHRNSQQFTHFIWKHPNKDTVRYADKHCPLQDKLCSKAQRYTVVPSCCLLRTVSLMEDSLFFFFLAPGETSSSTWPLFSLSSNFVNNPNSTSVVKEMMCQLHWYKNRETAQSADWTEPKWRKSLPFSAQLLSYTLMWSGT